MADLYERLDSALLAHADDDAAGIIGVSELDGFFYALGCAPQMVLPSVWLPAIWGGAAFMPQWRTAKEAETFHKDVMAHYNSVMNALNHSECAPLFLENEVDGKLYTVADEWCEGFLLGMFLWGDAADNVPEELLEPILFFTINLDAPEETLRIREEASDEEVELLQELIPQSVFGLRAHFGLDRRPPTGQKAPRRKR